MVMHAPSPTLRLAAGLVALGATLLILVDLAFGVLPDRQRDADRLHARLAEVATLQAAEALSAKEPARAQAAFDAMRAREPRLLSAAVREAAGGTLVVSSGPHAANWGEHTSERSTATRVVVAIPSNHGPWGRAEFEFESVLPSTLAGWLRDPMLWLALGLPVAATALVYLYLRRVLLHLNPMTVVPERLRDAFDGMTEGVALLDQRERIVLANASLRELAGAQAATMHGRGFAEAAGISWDAAAGVPPWRRVLQGDEPVRGVRVQVGPPGQRKPALMNCRAITDPQGRVRGCLTTIDDLSATERANEELRLALADLERSRERIEAQNQELMTMAMRDALTGLLNRRAYFERAGQALARCTEQGGAVAVLMLDVDHFKSFNDKYGHALGDQVLKRVADAFSSALRQVDVVARYGGEEFCALIEGTDRAGALAFAERVRAAIESQAGRGIHEGADLVVTASLGLCWRARPDAREGLSDLLRHADEALYEAKRGGRNRVQEAQARLPERRAAA
ncbi:MAG TPA: GGDEF domain-containing protein [Methylibium sp.]|uniref:GGDEF domain-containing protein n=1 Tax=Methylibium sp. TaxID=2067992 RepID=UPI002DBA839B|nr:GGDEF domain-containing protein [Methylibium sp.]HEU4460756.1 GGDEF domain-containing protein [Methylibium sp.]